MTKTSGGLERVPSGIDGLDTILGGGLFRAGAYIVQGTPGAGKTIFGNQVAYHHAGRGGRVLYVTLLAEMHARMLLHLESLRFFDPTLVPNAIVYLSAFGVLEEEGLKGLLALLRREVQARGITLLVLDGLVAAEDQAVTRTEFKKFVHELQAQVALAGCTALLLTSAPTGEKISAEHTMVDGIVELGDQLYGFRAERWLEVRKFRGSGFLRGRHPFRITEAGLVVYPRFEALYAQATRPDEAWQARLSTGVEELDTMLHGGIPAASTTALIGPSGAGKTSIGLQFVARASKAEPGLLFGFFESPPRLLGKAQRLGLDLEAAVGRGEVEILWQPPTENILDALAHRLIGAVQRRGVRRLFVDGLGGFTESTADRGRISNFFAALANELRALGVTTIYTLETRDLVGSDVLVPVDGISSLVENMLLLRYVEHEAQLRRLLSVVKLRDSGYDPRLRELVITARGISLPDTFAGTRELLSGSARADAPRWPSPSEG